MRLLERLLPQREQRAIDVGEAALQVKRVGEVGRMRKGRIEHVPLLPQPLFSLLPFRDVAPFGHDQHDFAAFVPDRVERYVKVLPLS